jgi:hypothetical protein
LIINAHLKNLKSEQCLLLTLTFGRGAILPDYI